MWNEPWDEGSRWQACHSQSVVLIPCCSAPAIRLLSTLHVWYKCKWTSCWTSAFIRGAVEEEGQRTWHGVRRRGLRRQSAGDNWRERGAGRRGKIRGEKSRKTSRECRRVLRCEWLSAAKQREWEWEGWGGKREKRSLQPLGSDGYLRTTGRGDHTVPLSFFFSLFKTHPIV